MRDAFERDREELAVGPDVLDCCSCESDEVCGCDCHFRPDADDLYDRWRDAQMEEE